ncbi:MAG: spirocyclase AveC family protein [bacterium]
MESQVTSQKPQDAPASGAEFCVKSQRRPWGPAQYLALASAPLLAYQFWTLTGWLIAGPHAVNAFRDPNCTNYYLAKIIEVCLSIFGIVFLGKLIYDSWKKRKMTFDLMMYIGFALTVFWDTTTNFFQPVWFYTANWVNLNDWWGNAPLIQNPIAGTTPFPILFLGFLYPAAVTGCAMLVSIAMSRAKRRWQDISAAKLAGIGFLASFPLWTCIDGFLMITHLWAGPGMPWDIPVISGLLGQTYHWGWLEPGFCITMGALIGYLRYWKISWQGTEEYSSKRKAFVNQLATIAACNLIFIVLQIPHMLAGFTYDQPYPRYPAHLVAGTCDVPGVATGTQYGLCPGAPGYKAPLRSTMKKEAAANSSLSQM